MASRLARARRRIRERKLAGAALRIQMALRCLKARKRVQQRKADLTAPG